MSQSRRGEQTWIDAAADRFEQQWTSGPQKPLIEDFLQAAEPNHAAELLEELVRVECELRRPGGDQPAPEEYLARFPDHRAAIAAVFGDGNWDGISIDGNPLLRRLRGVSLGFRVLKEVTLNGLQPISVVLGPNGCGQSTLFDVFGFPSDVLQTNVRKAIEPRGRLRELRSRGSTGPIGITVRYRESAFEVKKPGPDKGRKLRKEHVI